MALALCTVGLASVRAVDPCGAVNPLNELCVEVTSGGNKWCAVNGSHKIPAHTGGLPPRCKWSSPLPLWLKPGAEISCNLPCRSNGDEREKTCGCGFEFDFPAGVWLDPHALIKGSMVNVTASAGRITVSENATISADAMGQCGYGGSPNSRNDQPYNEGFGSGKNGAGHAGEGGTCEGPCRPSGCGQLGRSYGDATWPIGGVGGFGITRLHPLFGSGTNNHEPTVGGECCGGGWIVLEAGGGPSGGFQIDGVISANGETPQHTNNPNASNNVCQDLGGASGGTIVLQASGNVTKPFFNGTTGKVLARGADADQKSTWPSGGGSGGRMQAPVCMSGITFDAQGGLGRQTVPGQCQAGAAGTVFYLECDGVEHSLIVSNGMSSSKTGNGALPCTLLRYDDGKAHENTIQQAAVTNGAVLCLGQSTDKKLQITETLELSANAELVLGYQQGIEVQNLQLSSASISSIEVSQLSGTSVKADTLAIDTLSSLNGISVINVTTRAAIEGRVISPNPLTFNVGQVTPQGAAVGSLKVSTLGYIAAYTLMIVAHDIIMQGKMQAKAGEEGPFVLNCSATVAEQTHPHPMQFHTDFLTVEQGGVIASGGILVCAMVSVTVSNGGLSAAGIGLVAGTGPGHGAQADAYSPGSGGGHGGKGGRSGGFHAEQLVEGGETYGHDEAPGTMGSGGGGAGSNGPLGGDGGGVIHINTSTLELSKGGVFDCDGADGRDAPPQADPGTLAPVVDGPQKRKASPPPSPPVPPTNPHQGGGGGGAGGSILIAAQTIFSDGTGSISANGGMGGEPAGGGGGGGRVHLRPSAENPSIPWLITPEAAELRRIISASNGSASTCAARLCNGTMWQAEGGSPGNLTGPDCAEGQEHMLCQLCEEGSYKDFTGQDSCDKCSPGTFQDYTGQTACFDCPPGHDAPRHGMPTCEPCPLGTNASDRQTAHCEPCAAGSIGRIKNDGPNATTGDGGNRSSEIGATVCTLCPKQTWSREQAPSCEFCEDGKYPNKCYGGVDDPSCEPGSNVCFECNDAPEFKGKFTVGAATGSRWCSDAPGSQTRCRPDKPCAWECTFPFFGSLDNRQCGPIFEQILLQVGGGIEMLIIAPLLGGVVLLFLLGAATITRTRLMKRRKLLTKSYKEASFRSDPGSTSLADPLASGSGAFTDGSARGVLPSDLVGENTPTSLLGSAPLLESLSSAMLWEKHKYRSKQHVHRLYLTGSNSATQPWRLPLLPPELRPLMSETQYYLLSEEFNAAAAWRQWELAVYGLLHVLPPLATQFLEERRRRHWQRAVSVLRARATAHSEQLWRSLHTRVWEGHRLELGCCGEWSLGWIDMFANVAAPLVRTDGAPGAPGSTSTLAVSPGGHVVGGPLDQSPMLPPPVLGDSVAPFRLNMPPQPPDRSARSSGRDGPTNKPLPAPVAVPSGGGASARNGGPENPEMTAALFNSMHASSPSDGWALEGRAQRAGGPELFGSADDGWGCAHSEGGSWRPLNGEHGFRPSDGFRPSNASETDELGVEIGGLSRAASHATGLGLSPRVTATGANSPPPTALIEPRVAYQLCLCGNGSFLSPYHLELGDFLVYSGMAAALHDGGAACAACINAKLRRVDRWSHRWRSQLREVLELLDVLCRQLASRERRTSTAEEPTALALVHLSTPEENKRFVLLVGSGEPSRWLLPPSATLLRPEACATLSLPGFLDTPEKGACCEGLLEAPLHVVFGSFAPTALPRSAGVTVFLLLVEELFLLSLLLGTLCSVPEDPAALAVCSATVLCLPFACLASPIVGLCVWTKACLTLRGAARGQERALTELGSGVVGRLVHLGAVWNAASLVNALLALILFSTPSVNNFYVSSQHWLLPLCLLLTKLLLAQALKVFAASAGLTRNGWQLLTALEVLSRQGRKPDPQ